MTTAVKLPNAGLRRARAPWEDAGVNLHDLMPMPYTEFQLDGKSFAGLLAMKPDMEHVPPHWLIYFTVTNCDAALETAKSLGGEVLFGPFAVPDVGNIAVIKDPQGAVFGIAGG